MIECERVEIELMSHWLLLKLLRNYPLRCPVYRIHSSLLTLPNHVAAKKQTREISRELQPSAEGFSIECGISRI